MVINPWGLVVAKAPDGESAVVADIDLEILHPDQDDLPGPTASTQGPVRDLKRCANKEASGCLSSPENPCLL